MPLGMEVDLGLGHIVLDGDTAPLRKGHPSLFGPCLLWPWSPNSATAELLFMHSLAFAVVSLFNKFKSV